MTTFSHQLMAAAFALTAAMTTAPCHAQTFVGYMAYQSSWVDEGSNTPHCGWYTYDLEHNTFTKHTDDDYVIKACKGGTCAEGHLYAMESASDSWLFPDPKLNIYNADTYKLEHTVSYGRSDRDHATKDFAVNPADHRLYAIAQHRDGNTADGGWIQHYDLSTGEMTRLAHIPTYQHALAIDAEGHFYTLSEAGTLYRLTWDDSQKKEIKEYGSYPEAKLEAVGKTGYRLQGDVTYANSLCFDYRSGRLFWSASAYPADNYEGTDQLVRGLMEIDLTTGVATLLKPYPEEAVYTALAIPYLTLSNPDDIQDLTLRPQEPGSGNVAIGLTIPATDYGQTPYPADTEFRVHPVLDGRDYYQALLDAGYIGEGKALSESDFTAKAGEVWVGGPFRLTTGAYHTLGAYVECLTDGRVSQTAQQTMWVGFDEPKKPANVELTYNRERNTADVSWAPVEEGIHGGAIDETTLRYIVTRCTNNGTQQTDIALDAKECTITDHILEPMSYTRYEVTAITDPAMSDVARSEYAVLGLPRELPFTSTFTYAGEFNQFITIDANGDGFDDWSTPSWYFDSTYGAAFCYLNRDYEPQDDWLVTPALFFEPGEQYDIIFQSYGYYGKPDAPIHLQIAVGEYAEAESLSRVIYNNEYSYALPTFPYEAEDVLTEMVTFTAAEGDKYIGFHNITTSFDHMSLDNIFIRRHEGEEQDVALIPLNRSNATYYDLQGRRAGNTKHGLLIRDGRKSFVQ